MDAGNACNPIVFNSMVMFILLLQRKENYVDWKRGKLENCRENRAKDLGKIAGKGMGLVCLLCVEEKWRRGVRKQALLCLIPSVRELLDVCGFNGFPKSH